MVKRKLTKDEAEKTKAGIKRLKKELYWLKKDNQYNEELLAFNKKHRDYLQERSDKKNEDQIKQTYSEIEYKNNLIREMENHLKHGVESKNKT